MTQRDYDKEPIVIEDNNSIFLALITLSAIPIMIYIYIYNPGGTSEESLNRNILIIIPLMIYPYFKGYFNAKKKRKIVLLNHKIQFLHENIILAEIELSKITNIRKTYSDLYHKSQYISEFGKFSLFILVPLILFLANVMEFLLIIPLMQILLLLVKFIFHIYKDGLKSYRLLDAIMVFEGDKFINILPTTVEKYKEVEKYFKIKKGEDIERAKVFFEVIGHMPKKIKIKGR